MSAKARSFVVGTAGHIDHGKTSLVRALTGQETDRLPEEKKRGITIALGFAPWKVAKDLQASIVDMPGHESFVRTMVSGAIGIDVVVFVISAEDGVMPQTREHLNICRLLGISRGVVTLTKVDLLEDDPDAIELAVDDVREALADTPFAQAEIIPTSSTTGAGLEDLRRAVARLIREVPRRDHKGTVILPIDRAFTIKGHGTVITGTLMSGSVAVEKTVGLSIVPTGHNREAREIRARAAQVRGETTDRIYAGSRIALNLGGVQVSEVSRGDVITNGPEVVRTDTFHIWAHALAHTQSSWKAGTTVQLCAGTANVVARLDPLSSESGSGANEELVIAPGDSGLIRIRCETPVPIWRDQKIVFRSFSGAEDVVKQHGLTVGGGHIIDPEPSGGRGQRKRWQALGQALRRGDPGEQILALVHDAAAVGIDKLALRRRLGVVELEAALSRLTDRGQILPLVGERYVHQDIVRELQTAAVQLVDKFHRENPMQPGLSRAAVEGMLPGRVDPQVANAVVNMTIESGGLRVADASGNLARPGQGVLDRSALPPKMQAVERLYAARGSQPPTLKEVQSECHLNPRETLEVVGALQRAKILVRVSDDLSFHDATHAKLVDDVRDRLRDTGNLDVQAMKDITGLSRKFVMPLLEHLDQIGMTRRAGETRVPGPKSGV
ncbi:MAG: selenocysteine-specific translation elongation factor [Myxococcales bacterium FL481]|nr:MAG: selenocysteine-specific translation elongation factor [Myxococcales bacterium FL481]